MTRKLGGTDLKRLHRSWRRRTGGRVSLLLDNVQSPYNVGSILRTAASYRVEHLWLVGSTPEPTHPGVRKTALGTDRYLTWSRTDQGADAAGEAGDNGLTVVGIELADGAVPLHELAPADAVCLVVGNEDHGLGTNTLAACDVVAYLPQLGRVGSLNVATAAAIALYEIRRQEWTR